MEVLTTLLVILTVIQPFICLHPVIIWSQDSNQNSTFLLLIIFIWFLPICVHVLIKAVITPGIRKCKSAIVENETPQVSPNEHLQLRANHKLRKPSKTHHSVTLDANTEKINNKNTQSSSKRREQILKGLDLLVQVVQLLFFLVTFSIATNHIVNLEFSVAEGRKEKRENLQDFVLPAIISVFLWMVSISFLLLALGKIV